MSCPNPKHPSASADVRSITSNANH
jgi:hypothetical protein